ncbi:MAG: universal stress protein, partial [Flavobacteriaceae bacterium]|nr:universal stress protein [Flavobacteriaceae bacterium]
AMRLASFFDGNLFFLHVGKKTVAKEKTFLEILKDSPVNHKPIKILWEEGQPDKTIIFQCISHEIDLLLLGALQRENMVKFYLGSIARKITRKAPCTVLLLMKPSVERIPSQHMVVNAFESKKTETTINIALEFAQALDVPKITLVEEISRSKVSVAVDDDRSLRRATLEKEKLKRREISRVNEILSRVPPNLKENKRITSQSIFGARGYSIGHYATVIRADLLVMNAENKNSSLWSRFFTKDLEHILSELPTDVLIVQNKEDE